MAGFKRLKASLQEKKRHKFIVCAGSAVFEQQYWHEVGGDGVLSCFYAFSFDDRSWERIGIVSYQCGYAHEFFEAAHAYGYDSIVGELHQLCE